MTENKELERSDLAIDREMEVDDDNPHQINFYIETWFDVDRKFDLNINAEDGIWLNMYGKYDPYANELQIECEISREESGGTYFDYTPTENETKLIKDMLAQELKFEHHQTPEEFCEQYADEEQTLGG